MPVLRSDLEAAKAALTASKEPAKVVSMHPKVVDPYLRDLDRLDQVIAGDLAEGDDGLAKALREFLTKITVMPAPSRQAPEIKLEGYLEALLKQTFEDHPISGGKYGSGGGTRTPDPRIMIPVL